MKRPLGLFVLALLGLLPDCTSRTASGPPAPPWPTLQPGEVCEVTSTTPSAMRFDPPRIVVAPGQVRPARMIVDPDVCTPTQATFAIGNAAVAGAPPPAALDLRHATYDFAITGGAVGTTTLTSTLPSPIDGTPVAATLEIEVRDGAPPKCAKGPAATLTVDAQHATLAGAGDLAGASLAAPATAFARTDEMGLKAFPAELSCADDLTASAEGGLLPLGPAVSFAARAPLSMTKALRRELDFAIPVNPAAIPGPARLRHVQVLFSSPRAKKPRAITVADPRIEKSGTGYVFKFSSPWVGTYQAAVAPGAGTHHRKRRLTHRAIAGVSMGALGASTFGLRHHDQFDAIVPMGGPADWTWLLWYIETYALGGFCPASQPDCPKFAPNLYPLDEPFAHTMDFNHFWYQTGGGNGGSFPRNEYLQIFLDLALMLGNANGQNDDPSIPFFPRGIKANEKGDYPPWVVGDTTGVPKGPDGKPLFDCRITVNPIKDDPTNPIKSTTESQQQQFEAQCNKFRCAVDASGRMVNGYVAPQNYFDARFNPDGKHPVISFCDGGQKGVSPYVDTWAPPTPDTAVPVTVALAVDVNGNGVRDEGDPVVSQGHEIYDDVGVDGLADAAEPGYDPLTNPDPNQDDYDFQINPNGTEGNHRHDDGEPFQDNGLDGVPNTALTNVAGDVGEGDGKYTEANGLKAFYAADAHSILHQWSTNLPGGPLTDEALLRFDIWTDGGVRDLFNFISTANHVTGSVAARRLRTTAFYNGFDRIPGQVFGKPLDYQAGNNTWADVADIATLRYGTVDATEADLARGDGQHVGAADQLLHRVQTAFFYIDKSWPDAERTRTREARDNPETTSKSELGADCEIRGYCEKYFTGPESKRTGPIAIQLPPGYALDENRVRDVRYPVMYVLHGYGQDPRDLEALAILTNNFMNDGGRSYATRLAKMIVVYVDGRCRVDDKGRPECIRGTFWEEPTRAGAPKMDTWFMEVVKYVDQNYRTMGASEVDVTD